MYTERGQQLVQPFVTTNVYTQRGQQLVQPLVTANVYTKRGHQLVQPFVTGVQRKQRTDNKSKEGNLCQNKLDSLLYITPKLTVLYRILFILFTVN